MDLPIPWCDKCQKPCDRLEKYYDDFMMLLVLTAVCHGQRERVTVDQMELAQIRDVNLSTNGVAFRQPKQLSK